MSYPASGTPTHDLGRRFHRHLLEGGWIAPGDLLLVACSGGLDSLALLHLLRFEPRPLPGAGAPPPIRVEVAHFDHAMRPSSAEDAAWLSGVAAAWGVPLHLGHAREGEGEPPTSESGAREARYAFLRRVAERLGARWIVTAHHADDQAETVLFRALRGTGIAGLEGIPEARGGILRPLLPFPRAEIESYAVRRGLRAREDPTNRSLRFARNRIRREVLPELERVHPGARRGLVRLASHAADASRLLDRLLAPLQGSVVLERAPGRVVLDRDRFLALGDLERSEIFRRTAHSLGIVCSGAGTADALAFMTENPSGAVLCLPGDGRLTRAFGRLILESGPIPESGPVPPSDAPGDLEIEAPAEGASEIVCGGRTYEVRWGARGRTRAGGWSGVSLDPIRTPFPVTFRPWRPGDRTRTTGGGKKLKKLFGELEVPGEERRRLPLLVDAEGTVLWIPGWHVAPIESPTGRAGEDAGRSEDATWWIGVRRVDPHG